MECRWASGQKSCGKEYAVRFRKSRENAIKAQEHYNEALKVFTAENTPSEWAETLIARGRLKRIMTGLSSGEQRELRPDFFNRGDLFGTFARMSQGIENALSDFTHVL